MSEYRIETKCVQGGYTPGNGEPRQIPIYQSTTFKYDTSEHMGQLFDLEASGYFYSRLQNPTCDLVAAKIAALEGGLRLELHREPDLDAPVPQAALDLLRTGGKFLRRIQCCKLRGSCRCILYHLRRHI